MISQETIDTMLVHAQIERVHGDKELAEWIVTEANRLQAELNQAELDEAKRKSQCHSQK